MIIRETTKPSARTFTLEVDEHELKAMRRMAEYYLDGDRTIGRSSGAYATAAAYLREKADSLLSFGK